MSTTQCFALSMILSALPGLSYGQATSNSKTEPPVAVVDGQPISEGDLAPYIGAQLRPLREQEYQIKKNALETLIGQKLLEAEAKKKGLDVEKLMQQEVDAKIPEATDSEVAAVYAMQRDQLGGRSLAEVKLQIQQALKRARIQQARQEYSAKLRDQAKVAMLLSPPKTQVTFDATRVRGNPKAKVMIIEFSDFQCPYCGQVAGTLRNLLVKHEGTVALAFRDMPLAQIHPLAQGAAEAARCAGEQGKFWEYHDLLFGDQAGLDRSGLMAKAAKLSLDQGKFEQCFASAKYRAQVEQDRQEGLSAGVSGTPGFFINGVFISGAQTDAAFEKIIREQLEGAGTP